jgi:AcrR family transcriptional regulator
MMPKIVDDEKVYRAVMQMVVEHGYAGATTKLMAGAAGVSEVTLFRKYSSKAQLVKEAVATILGQVNIPSAAQYTGDLSADVLRIVETYQDAADREGEFFPILLSDIPRYPELEGVLDTPMLSIQTIAQLLARYQVEGALRQEHPLHTLASLIGPLLVTAMIRRTMPNGPLPPIDLPSHVAHFLEGHQV